LTETVGIFKPTNQPINQSTNQTNQPKQTTKPNQSTNWFGFFQDTFKFVLVAV
jgi:hypothetical protein